MVLPEPEPLGSSRFRHLLLIDLGRGSLLQPVFRLPFEFAVPDLLYEDELKGHGESALVREKLRVEELSGGAVARALGYRRMQKTLSLPDCFALALAKAKSWTLLAGDRALRELAAEEQVLCHGVLWLLDRLHEHRTINRNALHDGFRRIAAHPRCRLPQAEIRKRFHLYPARDPVVRDDAIRAPKHSFS